MKTKVMILTLFSILLLSSLAFADEVLVTVNGKLINHDDLFIEENGVVYGAVGPLAEKLGIEVNWMELPRLAVLKIDEAYYCFGVDTNLLIINNQDFFLKQKTIMRDHRVYVAMEDLIEQLGLTISYNEKLIHVVVTDKRITVDPATIRPLNYTPEDLYWLSKIVEIEARGGSVNKKTAVANVVLNRVASPRFPNTVYDVIHQRGQFPPVYTSRFTTLEPSENSIIAATRALMGVKVAKDCLFFNYIPWASKADRFYKLIEGDYFYY